MISARDDEPGSPPRRRARARIALALASALALAASPAEAVLIVTGDGSGNTSAPADDPGFVHVCVRASGLSCVYLGNGWVLTANHVGAGNVTIDGLSYPALAGSSHQLTNPSTTGADLLMFRIQGEPGLPALPVRSTTPALNATMTMIGNGFDRGTPLTWSGFSGWNWDTSVRHVRWGTNRVHQRNFDVTIGATVTRALSFDFDAVSGGTTDEAAAVVGDSGGPVFLKNGSTWELAGTLFAISGYDGQPNNTSLAGNLTYAVDLSYYRSQIVSWLDTPVCGDGLDNDGDGLVDAADAGCKSTSDASERFDCENQLDDDGDGLFDWPLDPGCSSATADVENPQCDDGADNDGDTLVDLADPGCPLAYLSYESPPSSCGLGPELAPLLGLFGLWRARRSAGPSTRDCAAGRRGERSIA